MLKFEKNGPEFSLHSELVLGTPLAEVFDFFSDAKNLEKITPPFLRFSILNPTKPEMKKGLLINYRLSLYGIPMYWQSEITLWDPPSGFIDEQRKGPYSYWIHYHQFEEKDGKTIVRDHVRYGVPGGFLAHELFVKDSLRKIFTYRTETISRIFGTAEVSIGDNFKVVMNAPLLQGNESLDSASRKNPLLVVFLRHSGCTFCRETLAKLSEAKARLDSKGIKLVLVHMTSDESAQKFFSGYSLQNEFRISDPERKVYAAFNLGHGTLQQLLGFRSFTKALFEGALWKHGIGIPEGDTFQMPGTFLLHNGTIIKRHVPESAGDEASFEVEQICSL